MRTSTITKTAAARAALSQQHAYTAAGTGRRGQLWRSVRRGEELLYPGS